MTTRPGMCDAEIRVLLFLLRVRLFTLLKQNKEHGVSTATVPPQCPTRARFRTRFLQLENSETPTGAVSSLANCQRRGKGVAGTAGVQCRGGRAWHWLNMYGCTPPACQTRVIQRGTRVLISLWDTLMFGRVPGTRPNISESHREISTRVPHCPGQSRANGHGTRHGGSRSVSLRTSLTPGVLVGGTPIFACVQAGGLAAALERCSWAGRRSVLAGEESYRTQDEDRESHEYPPARLKK